MRANRIFLMVFTLILTLAACSPAGTADRPGEGQPAETLAPVGLTQFGSVSFMLDSEVAASASGALVSANPGTADGPYWEVHPEYVQFSLSGYPHQQAYFEPRIAIYPVEEYRQFSSPAAETIGKLETFLKEQPSGPELIPSLPVMNSGQAFRVNLKYLDFQNGRGVRFLAMYAQAANPITNHDLVYSYQGLTADGQQAVSIFLPISHPSLPADPDALTPEEVAAIYGDYASYLAGVVDNLSAQPGDSFTPDLGQLDALAASLLVER